MTTEQELMTALEELVKLQSHYAFLLNAWDGGKRKRFESATEWIARLRQVGKLPVEPEPEKLFGNNIWRAVTVYKAVRKQRKAERERKTRTLVDDVKELTEALRAANDLCRSMHSIAARDGAKTNWFTFRRRLDEQLKVQHAILWPNKT